MSNKNEVFEYLIDQLRQQLPVVDVMGEIKRWSIDRSIVGRGIYTDEENAIIDTYIGMEHNPYKQQCEDLAHEVLSLKNQLRDASAQIKELHLALVRATGDAEAYKLIRKGGCIDGGLRYVVGEHVPGAAVNCRCTQTPVPPEQSGCRKEDVQVEKSWVEHDGAAACPVPDDTVVGIKFRNGEVESNTKALSWRWDTWGEPYDIVAYRVVKPECKHDWRVVQYSAGVETNKCLLCGEEKEVHYE